jgi:hypothetical protein
MAVILPAFPRAAVRSRSNGAQVSSKVHAADMRGAAHFPLAAPDRRG